MPAARERSESLDVDTQESRERLRFGLAELWELGGHLLHGTVPLTQLNAIGRHVSVPARPIASAGRRTVQGHERWHGADRPGGGRKPILGQRAGEGTGPSGYIVPRGGDHMSVALFQIRGAAPGERRHGPWTRLLGKKPQCLSGDVVVRRRQP